MGDRMTIGLLCWYVDGDDDIDAMAFGEMLEMGDNPDPEAKTRNG